MADGIRQFIRLELSKQALRQLEQDAAASSRRAGEAVGRELAQMGHQGKIVGEFTDGLREQFDRDLLKIRKQLVNGMIDLPEAKTKAAELATAFNTQLETKIKELGKRLNIAPALQAKLLGAMKVDIDSIAVEIHRSTAKELYSGIKEAVDKGKHLVRDLFTLANVPAMQPLSRSEDKELSAQFLKKGRIDREGYNTAVLATQKLHQLEGATLTATGKLYTWLGGNVATASAQIKALTTSLINLGVAKTQINQAMPFAVQGFKQLGTSAMAAARSLGLVYSAYQAISFAKSAVEVNANLEKSWAKLSVTVSDFGQTLESVRPRVEEAIQYGLRMGFTQEKTLETLARVTQITGDSGRSFLAHKVVLDIVASGYMTLDQASRQVSRAMLGDITQMQRYGIFLEKNVDVLKQLSERFGGEAAARAKTFRGQLEIMSASLDVLKSKLGAAIAEGIKAGGFMGDLTDVFKLLTDWIEQNREAISMWVQLLKYAFAGVLTILLTAIATISVFTNIVLSASLVLRQGLMAIPNELTIIFAGFLEVASKTFGVIGKMIDAVFGTKLEQKMARIQAGYEKVRTQAQADLGDKNQEGRLAFQEIWQGSSLAGDVPTQDPSKTRTPRARYFLNVGAEIAVLRKVILGKDQEASEKAIKRMDELYKSLSEQAEIYKENEREALDYQAKMADIDKIRETLAKRKATIDRDARNEAALTQRINILGNIALGKDLQRQKEALTELAKLHDELIVKRDKLNIHNEKYWRTQNHIKEIEDKILAVQAQADSEFDKKVKKLALQVDLGIESVKAEADLLALYKLEQAILDDKTSSVDAQINARLRQVQIETAARNEMEKTSARIAQLTEDLKDPAKRLGAERELVRTRDLINTRLAKGLVLSSQVSLVNAQILAIDKAIADNGAINLRQIDKQLRNAEELSKHEKTRKDAAAEYARVLEYINLLLSRENLTPEERDRLKAERERATRGKRKAEAPDLDVFNELKRVVKEDLPDIFANAAEQSAKVFETAFTYILRDARNLKHALSSIPKGLAAAILDELSQLAHAKVKEHLAWALSEFALGLGNLAFGNVGASGTHFAAAAEHTAAAAAWGLLAGGVGSLGMSAHTAYANATDFTATGNRGTSGDNAKRGGDIYLYIDGVDPSNPRHQQLVGDAQREYSERYGGRIIVMPGRTI